MNNAIHKSTERSQVDILPLNGFGSWNYSFNRDIERFGTRNLKAKIIVDLLIIEDMTGAASHKIFTSISNYEMSITEDVSEDDFFHLYQDAYQKMKEAFLFFQKQVGKGDLFRKKTCMERKALVRVAGGRKHPPRRVTFW